MVELSERGRSEAVADVQAKVAEAARRHNLFPEAGEPLVVGVSGGADSLCLLHVLRDLQPRWGYRLHVGHLNHGLRGASADEDAAFVEETCRLWGIPVTVERVDVAQIARQARLSVEEAGRHARYAFLGALAARLGGRVVAVAHNADDQVETVLMHWLRGSGLAGLRGILPKVELGHLRLEGVWDRLWPRAEGVWVVRPLLSVTRAEIAAYCRHAGLEPRFDLSNLDTTYFRNRLRHELLPLLETYNPRIREVLRRSAAVMADDYAYLREQTLRAWAQVVREETSQGVALDLARFLDLHPSLQRGLLREAIRRLRRSLRNINWVHVERALQGARDGPTGTQITLARGLVLTKGYDVLWVGEEGIPLPSPWEEGPLLEAPVALPQEGDVALPGTGWHVRVRTREVHTSADLLRAAREDRWRAFLDAEALQGPLTLRPRRPGDRFFPSGMGGASVLVREFLINVKLPRQVRDRWPLLCAGEEVAWVVGWRVDARFLVVPTTRRVVEISLKREEAEGRSGEGDETSCRGG
ncbi:MAG: tRNA lysidine(34) synthetase TilS [Anaerolineae bacterium]